LTISNGQAVSLFGLVPLGGGLWNYSGNVTVRRCTFVNNHAQFGGALMCYQGQMTADHCTFSGNGAASGGGAIETGAGVPQVSMTHCTIVSNSAPAGGGVHFNNGLISLRHCLVAANAAPTGPDINLSSSTYAPAPGFNLVGDGTTSGIANGVNGNLVGSTATPINARLGALRLNGGNTLTHAPMGGSPAIDAGDPLFNGFNLTDQRGLPRVANSRIDIGAVENSLFTFYSFDNFSTSDSSGASTITYLGGPSGPWWNSDHRGQGVAAIALNDPGFGTNNYYRVTALHYPTNSNRGLGLKGDFTVSAWVYVRQSNSWNVVLGNTGSGVPGTLVFGLSSLRPYFAFWNNDIFSPSTVPLNQWTHLAWTYNSFGGQMAIYVNGALVASDYGRTNTTTDADVLLGFSEALPDSYFRGFIDEFAVIGQALSPSQITALAGPAGGTPANVLLPPPVLSPSLALGSCDWSVREIRNHSGDPSVMPYDLASALHVANTPQFGIVTNYNSSVINRVDPDVTLCCAGPFSSSAIPFASNLPGDTDHFILAARTSLHIATENDYTFGFASDDGAQLRIVGTVFSNSNPISVGNPANPAHRGDTLAWPGVTGNSTTLGVAHLLPGTYEIEYLSYEATGGAFSQVFAASGVHNSLDGSFRLLSPNLFLPAPFMSIARTSPTQVSISWNNTNACQRLQSAPVISGPWSDVPGFINGGALNITATASFFRVAQ
jgi:predicted outer membrane repeat protein